MDRFLLITEIYCLGRKTNKRNCPKNVSNNRLVEATSRLVAKLAKLRVGSLDLTTAVAAHPRWEIIAPSDHREGMPKLWKNKNNWYKYYFV